MKKIIPITLGVAFLSIVAVFVIHYNNVKDETDNSSIVNSSSITDSSSINQDKDDNSEFAEDIQSQVDAPEPDDYKPDDSSIFFCNISCVKKF